MNLDTPIRVPRKLTVLRIVRGLLVVSLGLIFIALANFYIRHQTIIHGMPVFDPLIVILFTPPTFTSFGIGIFHTILEFGYLVGLHNESNLNLPILVVSFVLEFILIVMVLAMGVSGALIVPGYGTFMYIAVSQFVLFIVLVLADIHIIYRV